MIRDGVALKSLSQDSLRRPKPGRSSGSSGIESRPVRPARRERRGRVPATGLAAFLLFGCGPSPDDPLPSTDDLYVYSLAVAEKARLKVRYQEARARLNLGQVHERFGFEDKALEEYSSAIARDLNLGMAYQRTGFILSQRGNRMTEAIEAYQQALRCNPGASGIYTRLGLIFLHQDRPIEAVAAFGEEIRQQTASAETHYHLGQALSKQGKTAESIKAFRDAFRLDPFMRSAQYSLARELRVAGDTTGAEASLARFRELKEAEDAAAARQQQTADNRARERRFAAETWLDAGDLFHRAANAPADGDTPQERQEVSRRAGVFDQESLDALREALRLDETYDDAWSTYLRLVESHGRFEAALEFADQARKADPASGVWPYRLALLQKRLAQQGDASERRYRDALDLLEAATRNAPGVARAHYALAWTVLMEINSREADRVRQAVEHAKRAVDLEPSALHYDVLALAHHRAGRFDLARQALEEGLRKNPDAANLLKRLELLRKSTERDR